MTSHPGPSHDADIARALATPGGHLMIGRGGFTLYYGRGWLSGYDCDGIKATAVAAGLPVIDSRNVGFDLVARLAVCGPMVAVNAEPSPRPWHSLSYAPLAVIAAAYRRIGAEVFNIPEDPETEAEFASVPPGPAGALIDFWLDHVLAHAG